MKRDHRAQASVEELFASAFGSITKGFGRAQSFLHYSSVGLARAMPTIRQESAEALAELGPAVFVGEPSPDMLLKMHEAMASTTYEQQKATIRGAALLFGHSVLDDVCNDLLWAVCHFDGKHWNDLLRDKEITIGQVLDGNVDLAIKAKKQRLIAELCKEGLPKRIQEYQAFCDYDASQEYVSDWKYDHARLCRLDDLRHRVVHSASEIEVISNIEGHLTFLRHTATSLISMLHLRFGVKLDSDLLMRGLSKKQPAKPGVS